MSPSLQELRDSFKPFPRISRMWPNFIYSFCYPETVATDSLSATRQLSPSSIHALGSLTFSRTSACSEGSCCWGAAVSMARLAELLPFSRRVRAELLFDKLLEPARISWRTILTTLLKSASVLPLENQRGVDVLRYLQLAAACHQPKPRSHVWFLLWHR